MTVAAVAASVVAAIAGASAVRVEEALQAHVDAALRSAGIEAAVRVDGRDAVVETLPGDGPAGDHLVEVVRDIPGIRVVTVGREAGPTGAPVSAPTPTTISTTTVTPTSGGTPSAAGTAPSASAGTAPSTGTHPAGPGASLPARKYLRFDSGVSDLTPRARAALDKIARFVRRHPDVRLRVRGFTDDTGSSAGNQALARLRADAVAAYLVNAGVARDKLLLEAYGSGRPRADNHTLQGRAANRRVEIDFERVG